MAVIEIAKIQVRRGQENLTGMPQLDSGEFGWAEDTENLYIGKRIVDGAADDKNSRILTETDLVNIFAAINSTSTSAVYYKYRQDVDYINTMTVAQTVQKKLDDASPSLTDFGVIQDFSGTDITLQFKRAVETIFKNGLTSDAYQRSEARRTLRVPAGNYTVSQPIDLPPYARITGEGGIWMSINDYEKWINAFDSNKIFKKKSTSIFSGCFIKTKLGILFSVEIEKSTVALIFPKYSWIGSSAFLS
jgi:hypothetical protein